MLVQQWTGEADTGTALRMSTQTFAFPLPYPLTPREAAVQAAGERIARTVARVPGAAFAVLSWDRRNRDDVGNSALAFAAFAAQDGSRLTYLQLGDESDLIALDAAERNMDEAADEIEGILETIDLVELNRAGGSRDVGVFRARHLAAPTLSFADIDPWYGEMVIAYLIPAAII